MRLIALAALAATLAAPAAARTLNCTPQQVCGEQGCTSQKMPLGIQDFEGASPVARIQEHAFPLRRKSVEPPRLAYSGRFGGLPVEIEVDSQSGALAWSHGESFLVIGTCRPA